MNWKKYGLSALHQKYEIHDFKHAAAILAFEFPTEFAEICRALMKFKLDITDITEKGGNESKIPKKFSSILRPLGWKQVKLTAKLVVDSDKVVSHDTHKVDYVKGRVAFDLEWNSKDQTFDRDLYALRAFFDYDKISAGIIVTRSDELDGLFEKLGGDIENKYGASTTHMSKLIPRLEAGRNGGCPVLVFGITSRLLS